MTFEFIVENDDSTKILNEEQKNLLVKNISSKFASLNSSRSSNLDMASNLANEIFFKNDFKYLRDKNKKWKAKIKMCKTFMFYQTLKAFIWRNTYANVSSMFDVSGENHDSNNMSNKQKAMLVDIFEKMDFQKTCDKVIDNALLFGELISFTAWKKNYQEYRRPVEFFQNLFSGDFVKLPKVLEAIKQGKNYWVDTKKIYDNPYVYPVNPADLVFDTAQVDNWDSCPKIYRTYKTPTDIVNNQYYKLSDEEKEEIFALVASADSKHISASSGANFILEDIVNGSTIEVLEHWGDLKLPSGEVLKNWHAVIVGRKYLVEFGKNERLINPFSYGAFITDPETKRGISPLYCILSLAHFQEDLVNRTCNLQALNENPPLLAPEGFFDEDEIELYPGKIIEYGDNLTPTAAFQQMNFNPTVFLNDISFLNDLMAEVSGIFPNMIGSVETTSPKTATEINTKAQGQMTRLSMLVDTINQDFILPNVEKVAKLCADFKSGIETVFLNKENQPELIEIDDAVRQAEYKYTYSDRSNASLKSEQADMLVQAVEKFAQKINLNLEEIFIWYFEQKGVDNPERFLSGVNGNSLPPFLPAQSGLISPIGLPTQKNEMLPQLLQQQTAEVANPLESILQDEEAGKKIALLKQFLTRKADKDTISKILTSLRN
ncbi:MAG: hypothetical protein E7Z92_04475 [Cyanobacteria bacterium SIG31]|nr:hypothetical protein [Cyanobacteria bacterium SIG31]